MEWWDDTPVDLFFAAGEFHAAVGRRRRVVPFGAATVRVLSAEDLAVFKARFDRGKDWVDIETMVEAGALDVEIAAARLAELLPGDACLERLRSLKRAE